MKTILVPVEPSEEMLRAGVRAFQKTYISTDTLADWRACFKATCAAAPNPPTPADDRDVVLRDILDYCDGSGSYVFFDLPPEQRANAAFDAWQNIKDRIRLCLAPIHPSEDGGK